MDKFYHSVLGIYDFNIGIILMVNTYYKWWPIVILACLFILNSGCDSDLFKLKVVPVITDLSAEQYEVDPGDTIQVAVTVEDQDEALQYHWTSTGGQFIPPMNQPIVQWIAPDEGGTYRITVTVSNGDGESDPSSEYINVRIQEPPKILSVECSAYTVDPGDTVDVSATLTNASDPGLDYQWTAEGGNFLPPVNQPQVQWKAPAVGGVYRITLTVANNDKVSDPFSQSITVRSFAAPYVEIITPADNSVFLQYSQIELAVQANHQNGIESVSLYLDETFISRVNGTASEEYRFTFQINEPAGIHILRIEAVASTTGVIGADEVAVRVEGVVLGK
jgi:hypothetical protein